MPSPEYPETSSCLFLTKLPAELRNAIYELVFKPETNDEDIGGADIRTATPPNKNLILVCRQISQEATKLRRDAYRRFWRTTHFKLSFKPFEDTQTKQDCRLVVDQLDQCDIENISQITIQIKIKQNHTRLSLGLVDPRGGWQIKSSEVLQHGPSKWRKVYKPHYLYCKPGPDRKILRSRVKREELLVMLPAKADSAPLRDQIVGLVDFFYDKLPSV